MRQTHSREFYIPQGSRKIADKRSDGVVYIYEGARTGRPAGVAFHGKATKPDWHYTFRNARARESKIIEFFKGCRQHAERKAGRAQPHSLKVGDVLYTSWGYDQTNVSFYQVTRIVGRQMVEVRKIGQVPVDAGDQARMTGKVMPDVDAFKDEPLRRRVNGQSNAVRIDDVRTAFVWDGRPMSWTSYA